MFEWNEESVGYLKAARADKRTASEIAAHFGITRSAVLGKANRIGLSGTREDALAARRRQADAVRRAKAEEVERENKRRSENLKRENAFVREMRRAETSWAADKSISRKEAPETILRESKMLNFDDWREQGGCAWIFGDLRGLENKRYCGAPTRDKSAWCEHHHSIVYPPRVVVVKAPRAPSMNERAVSANMRLLEAAQ